jgi:poly(3-hydroxybutyrate) depolymerase
VCRGLRSLIEQPLLQMLMAWSCDACCPGCQARSIDGGHICNGPSPPPSPGGGYLCYQSTCYKKTGGMQTKAQCESTCGLMPPPPPGPPGQMYECWQGTCYPGKGTQTKAQCDATCGPASGILQTSSNMTWAGKERQYMSLVPEHQPPTGLIVVLDPVLVTSLSFTCPPLSEVARKTGAVVVCPAALSHIGTKGGTPGECWKAWAHYGTCGVTEDPEDVDFLAALIHRLIQQHNIRPPQEGGQIIMAGMSNGGSMAFWFNCEKSELIGGLAIQSQAYFDPYVGFYDYQHGRVPNGTPQCNPAKIVPFYSDIGTNDVYYGPNVADPAFRGHQKWLHNYSTAVLGCSGEVSVTDKGPHDYPAATGPVTCYEFASCPKITGVGLNRFCSVPGMGHDSSGYQGLLPAAFADFFGEA